MLAILNHIGVEGDALQLLHGFLKGRKQRVKLHGEFSGPLAITQGVPQGSILGPLLFSIYTHRLPEFVSHCKVHMYADDLQLY